MELEIDSFISLMVESQRHGIKYACDLLFNNWASNMLVTYCSITWATT